MVPANKKEICLDTYSSTSQSMFSRFDGKTQGDGRTSIVNLCTAYAECTHSTGQVGNIFQPPRETGLQAIINKSFLASEQVGYLHIYGPLQAQVLVTYLVWPVAFSIHKLALELGSSPDFVNLIHLYHDK